MSYFRDTRGWGDEAERWLGEDVLAGWRMAGGALHQRVSAVRMMFSMWLTVDVVSRRMDHMTDAERTVLSKCALCGGMAMAKGRRDEHLLFECTAASVVKLRAEVETAMEKEVSRLVKPGPVREAIMVPWRLDGAGRPPNVEVMAEVEAALGTVLGAASLVNRRVREAGDEARDWRGDSWR